MTELNQFKIQTISNIDTAISSFDGFTFAFVLSGNIQLSLGENSFDMFENNAVLILPRETFSFMSYNKSKVVFCQFYRDFLRELNELTVNSEAVMPIFSINEKHIIENLTSSQPLLEKSSLYIISHKFLNCCALKPRNDKVFDFINQTTKFIADNFDKDISLDSIAKFYGYSYNYMSMMFNTTFKAPFNQVLNTFRLKKAEDLLISTQKTIIDIAFSCGFKSLRSFNRNYQQYFGLSPSEFRKSLL